MGSIDLVNREHRIRISLWIPDNKDLFDKLLAHREEIESIIGYELDWDKLEGKKASIICTSINGLDFNKQDNYDSLMEKSIDTVVLFRDAFKSFI